MGRLQPHWWILGRTSISKGREKEREWEGCVGDGNSTNPSSNVWTQFWLSPGGKGTDAAGLSATDTAKHPTMQRTAVISELFSPQRQCCPAEYPHSEIETLMQGHHKQVGHSLTRAERGVESQTKALTPDSLFMIPFTC